MKLRRFRPRAGFQDHPADHGDRRRECFSTLLQNKGWNAVWTGGAINLQRLKQNKYEALTNGKETAHDLVG